MPKVQVTVKHDIPNQKQDAMSVWIESATTSQFEVCLQESRTFDGPHNNLVVVRPVLLYHFFVHGNWLSHSPVSVIGCVSRIVR